MAGRSPYLGPETYALEHRDLFFGRDAEGRIIASMLAAEPVSIVTGPSGSGKSSLLRAHVIPTLASRGWCPVYAHAQDDPVRALREELIAQALPDGAAERDRLDLLLAEAPGELSGSSLLSEVAPWFASLERYDRRRTTLVADRTGSKIPRHSLIALLLAGVYDAGQVACRLSILADYAGEFEAVRPDSTIDECRAALCHVTEGHEQLLNLLKLEGMGLSRTAEALWSGWVKAVGMLGIVFVLDQAEELYTSYGAMRSSSAAPLHDWSRREELFAELTRTISDSRHLPFRFCFSLRPEWYAPLRASLGSIAPPESRGSHFLTRFDEKHATEAIQRPAKAVASKVTANALRTALLELSKGTECGEIDPFLIAVTFDLAWKEAQKRKSPDISSAHLNAIMAKPDGEGKLPLVEGAMRRLVDNALQSLASGEKFDSLEMMESLFNEDGSRRIVAETDLVRRPLRDETRLRRLLGVLDEGGLIRRSRRGEVSLVEVRHERIAPIVLQLLEAQRENDAKSADGDGQLRSFVNRAISLLLTYDGTRLDAQIAAGLTDDPLPAWASTALLSAYDDVVWDQAAARVMLASLLQRKPGGGRLHPATAEEETARWRKLVGDFIILAGRRRGGDVETLGRSRRERERFAEDLQRGTRVTPKLAAQGLASGRGAFTSDVRLLLLRSILALPMLRRAQDHRGEIRTWMAKSFGVAPLND
ncbi:MAG TPA: hypothetical protein VEZ20_14335 [Allosphingosinicella sp.]|jgi:hypothetical protein|nr:hypothetical protein [Allosphingosinicella sp.]